jgi:hypothetical protein
MKQNFSFVLVSIFTILAASLGCYLAVQPHLSLEQAQIFDTCNQIWRAGATALFAPLVYLKLLP